MVSKRFPKPNKPRLRKIVSAATTRVSGYVSNATDHICPKCCVNGIALSVGLNSMKNAGTTPDTSAVTRIAVRIPARRVALRSLAIVEARGGWFCFDLRERNTVLSKRIQIDTIGISSWKSIEAADARRR